MFNPYQLKRAMKLTWRKFKRFQWGQSFQGKGDLLQYEITVYHMLCTPITSPRRILIVKQYWVEFHYQHSIWPLFTLKGFFLIMRLIIQSQQIKSKYHLFHQWRLFCEDNISSSTDTICDQGYFCQAKQKWHPLRQTMNWNISEAGRGMFTL